MIRRRIALAAAPAGALAAFLAFGACRAGSDLGREATWATPARGAVVSEHPLATEVGLDVLRRGGNAADAAVATALALSVVYPQAGNLGGGGFALWVPHRGGAQALDFRETAPAAARAEPYLAADGAFVPERSTAGPLSVAVPGSPAGLAALRARFGSGRFTLAQLAAPAIALARDGFRVDAWLARDLAEPDVRAEMNAAAQAVFFPDGRPLREGERLVQTDLARTLDRLGREGPQAFYEGSIADAIVAEVADTRVPRPELGGEVGDGTGRGWITRADLAAYEVQWRIPIVGWFRGREILTMPPPSSGGVVLLQALGVLEGLPLDLERDRARSAAQFDAERVAGGEDPGLSERMAHWWIEALRGAFADRARYMGDPGFVTVPVEALLSPTTIARRRIAIGERARPDVAATELEAREGGQTTHLSVLDEDGNAVSLTTTLNTTFGSGILVRGAGFLLNDEMDDFAILAGAPNAYGLVGGEANALAPGKRPLSSMTPTVVRDGGHANTLVLGSPGGPRIITAVAQVLLRAIVLEEPLERAVAAPRLHQQWKPVATRFEPGFDERLIRVLEERFGHAVERTSARFGSVQAIGLTGIGSEPVVVSDPRRGGAGAVQGSKVRAPARPGDWPPARGGS